MGTRVTRAAAHLSAEEVKARMRREPRFWVRHRWWIVYTALIAPGKAEEIAKQTGVSVSTVRRVIAGYKRLGPAAVETAGKGGRRKASMSLEQERQVLAPFFARAQRGEIAPAGEIKQAFEAQVGHEVEASTMYRVLHRHGWRQLVRRPRHPKAKADTQATFKKTFKPAYKRCSPRVSQPRSDQCCRWPKMKGALGA